MSQIILDLGSGNSCHNSAAYAREMIDFIADIDSHKHEVILKWQLESENPPGQKKLDHQVFLGAYQYAAKKGYKTTSSVFDRESLLFLMSVGELPFIKIACQPKTYELVGFIPRAMPVYLSADPRAEAYQVYVPFTILCCIPEYPAKLKDYPPGRPAYSDHTPGLELWNYYHPQIWEKHFVLERDPKNPDSGSFALIPEQLKEIIG